MATRSAPTTITSPLSRAPGRVTFDFPPRTLTRAPGVLHACSEATPKVFANRQKGARLGPLGHPALRHKQFPNPTPGPPRTHFFFHPWKDMDQFAAGWPYIPPQRRDPAKTGNILGRLPLRTSQVDMHSSPPRHFNPNRSLTIPPV
jgi:hypothetical protein